MNRHVPSKKVIVVCQPFFQHACNRLDNSFYVSWIVNRVTKKKLLECFNTWSFSSMLKLLVKQFSTSHRNCINICWIILIDTQQLT